jgi:hypothetical protein
MDVDHVHALAADEVPEPPGIAHDGCRAGLDVEPQIFHGLDAGRAGLRLEAVTCRQTEKHAMPSRLQAKNKP